MIIDQPDASSSTNSPSPPHLATFVVDPNLPRERYVKLIEAEGVIHKLVQRLMEKHGGENNLRLALLITSTGSHTRTSFRQDFTRPTSFLVSLPKLAMRFVLGRSASRPGKAWPAFSDITNVADESRVKGINVRRRKHEVEAEQGLLDGVVGGLELLDKPHIQASNRTASQTLESLTPASAQPLLSSLFSQPPISSPKQKYLLVIARDSDSAEDSKEGLKEIMQTTGTFSGDEISWDKLAEKCKEKEVRCSCAIIESGDGMEVMKGSRPSKRLRKFFEETTIGPPDNPWFDVPQDLEVYLSGYTIEEGTVPPLPTVVQSSTVGTEYFVTPSSTAVETPAPTAQNAQRPQLTQQNALRLLQTQMSRSGGNISGINPAQLSPAVIQNILVAAKNGNIDLGNPALQQFKNLLMLQQQQKQGQLSMNPGAAAAAAAMPGPVPMAPSGDQTFQAAMNGQKAPPAPANVAVPAQTANNSPAKLWSGDIAWVMNGVNGQQNFRLSVDTFPFSASTFQDVQLQEWPSELRIGNAIQINIAELQNYAKLNRTPCVIFVPAQASVDPANANRHQQFVNSLHSKGTMAIIPFGQPDRGIVLFAGPPAAPDNDGQRILRLMGVVCSTVPFPTFNRGPPAQPQQNVPQPVIPQPKVIHPPQQQIQPVSVNGMPSYQTMPPQSGMQPLSAGMNQMYQAQQQQNYQQAQPIPQPRQLQPPFQQMQQQLVVQPQVRPHLNSGIPERISPEGIQAIMEAARRNHVNLPPGFDPNSLPRDKLANVLRVIQTAEARNKQQQQEQFQQAQQQPQPMGQTYGQQMRPGQGQFMQ